MDILYDINGYAKPNSYGRDQFKFLYCPDDVWCDGKGGFCTYRDSTTTTRQKRLEACKQDAQYCSSLLEWDNWEFKSDYPYLK